VKGPRWLQSLRPPPTGPPARGPRERASHWGGRRYRKGDLAPRDAATRRPLSSAVAPDDSAVAGVLWSRHLLPRIPMAYAVGCRSRRRLTTTPRRRLLLYLHKSACDKKTPEWMARVARTRLGAAGRRENMRGESDGIHIAKRL
jgi:hypothetical protein